MSAFIVDKLHIDAMVMGAIARPAGIAPRPGDPGALRFDLTELGRAPYLDATNADRVGQMLVDANISSILARYPDCETNPERTPGPVDAYYMKPYRFEYPPARLTALELLSATACYEYQACETKTWEASQARAFCVSMQRHLIRLIPGYSSGPWEVTAEYYRKRSAA